MSRSRAWCFTINNYTFEDILSILDLGYRYVIFAFEEGEQGTPHIQGYVYYDDAKTRTSISKIMTRAHLQVANGSLQDNIQYIRGPYNKNGKEKPFNEECYEDGDPPAQGKLGKERIEQIMSNPWENFHLYVQYKKVYTELIKVEHKNREKSRVLKIISEDDKYNYPGAFLGDDLDTYEEESILVQPCYTSYNVMDWVHGFPPKIKRGYQVITIDPDEVYLYYRDDREKKYLIKKYFDYIDDAS